MIHQPRKRNQLLPVTRGTTYLPLKQRLNEEVSFFAKQEYLELFDYFLGGVYFPVHVPSYYKERSFRGDPRWSKRFRIQNLINIKRF